MGSVLISRQGKIAYEDYTDGLDSNTLRDTRSATKTVVSMLIGIAIDRGLIQSVADLVMPLFKDKQPVQNPDPRKDSITIEDLLTMSSILECDDSNQFSRGNEERMYLIEDWIRFALDLPIRAIRNPNVSSSRNFSYCTAGTSLLGEVVQRVAKEPLQNFAKRTLFSSLAIEGEQWVYNPLGSAFAGGGLRLKSLDLLKLGQLYLDGGKWNGTQIIPRWWVDESTKPQVVVNQDTEYGYLWWLRTFYSKGRKFKCQLMQGNGGNKICVCPDYNLVAVITSTNYSTTGMHEQTDRLLTDHILASVEN